MTTESEGVVNSNAYWNRRFRENWIASSGREQTAFFAHVALEAFPAWFHDYLSQTGRSLCDMGCALGEASDLLAGAYPQAAVTGVDFSEEAIAIARARGNSIGRVHFEPGDIASYATPHDVFFCSNTLEHFANPQPLIEQMCRVARDYVVVLVPFWDIPGAISEHEVFFGETMFARHVPGWMRMAHAAIIDCRRLPETRWQGYQALMILERVAEPAPPETAVHSDTVTTALPDFPASSAFRTGRITFDLPSTRLETSFLRGPEASRTLVVWFRGAVDRSASAPAYEVPLNPAYAGWAHQIALRDPTLDLNPDLRLGWYIGGPEHDLQIELCRFFATLRATLDLDRIIYIGSSGGGFASLFFSRHDDKSCAIAIEPETDARNYYYFRDFAKLAWPDIPSDEIARKRSLDLYALYGERFENTVIYIQNAANQKHRKNQMLPFVTAAETGNGANLICHSDYWGRADHGTIPATVTSLWLKAVLTAASLRSEDVLLAYRNAREERAIASATNAEQPSRKRKSRAKKQ